MFVDAGLGLGWILAGLVITVLVWVLLRLLPRQETAGGISSVTEPFFESQSSDAVIVIQAGGRVEYVSQLAREWFGLQEGEIPDLERLARRVRPSEEFLELCAAEGHKRFSVNGRLADAASYRVPGFRPVMLLSLRSMDLGASLSGAEGGQFSSSILKIVSEFGQTIPASLNLDATLGAIFQNVGRLVSADVMEIKLEDSEAQSATVYRYEESEDGPRAVQAGRSQLGDHYFEFLRSERRPIFAPDGRLEGSESPALVKSYIGIPLLVEDEFLGTLEVGQTVTSGLTKQDLELLQLIGGQAAVAIRNAHRFEVERERVAELSGLAKLSQAAGSIQESKELFTRLVETVAPLFNVEIVGFLIYHEKEHLLEGQVPFQGLPANVVAVYRSVIQPKSQAEQVLQSQQSILSMDAPGDSSMQQLGLNDIAQLASVREIALVPLLSSGRMIGYLQLSNHRNGGAPFSVEELRLANIVAGQAATIIDNALLVQDARQRGLRSESLRRIASLVASSATLDEILQFSVTDLTQLLRADVAAIYLLDEQTHELRAHLDSVWGVPPETVRSLERMQASERELRLATVSGSQRSFLSGRLSVDERVSPVYRRILDLVRVESVILVPLLARERSLGELMIGSRVADFFNSNDMQMLSTAAGLLAAAVEGAALLNQTDETLRRRVEQLTAITHVARELNASMDPSRLLEVIHEQSLRMARADCGTILLFDPDSDPLEPRVTYRLGCPVEEPLTSLTRQALVRREPLVFPDFESDLLRPPHEDVRSALVVPIVHQSRILGIINLHSPAPNAFDQSAFDTLQTLALQAAIALGNARRFQEQTQAAEQLKNRATALTRLAEISSTTNFEYPLEKSLLAIASAIQQATPFQVALLSMYELESGLLRRMAGVGLPDETLQELLSRKQPLQSIQQLLRPEFKIGRSYLIPADKTPVIPADAHTVILLHAADQGRIENAWDPEDFLLLPLEDPQGQPLGLLSVDAPRNNLRPDRATLETLEVFAAQAELVIFTQRRTQELKNRIDSLTSGLQRQQRLLSVTQNDLPTLLRKDLDQTISIHDLDRRVQRIRAGLAITEKVSSQIDAPSALLALGREMLTQLSMSVALIAEESPDGPRLLQVLGSVPKSVNPEALFGQRNPLRTILQTGESIIIPNLEENDEWRESALLSGLRAKGVVCLPIKIENRVEAGVLAVSPEAMAGLTDEDRQVYYQIARQTGVVLQNISLLGETRRRLQEVDLLLDFSRQLSGLNPDHIVRALLDSARRVISAAHAGSVLLWDAQSLRLVPRAVSGYADNEGMKEISFAAGEALPGVVFASGKPRRVDEFNLTRDYPLNTDGLMLYRRVTGGRLPVSSLLVPILAGEHNLGVLVLDNFNTPAAFKPVDETLLISLSQQVALSLENVRLMQATEERAGQLQALTDVAATITSSLQRRDLIASLLDQLSPVLPYDTATLWMREKEQLTVHASRGFPDPEQLLGLKVQLTDSALFKQMIRAGQPLVVGDVREDPRFPPLEAPRLSWMGIPLMAKGEVIGLIALEKSQANFYTSENIQVATTFASQAAVALENARLFEDSLNRAAELDQRSQRLALLNRFSSALGGLLDSEQIVELSAQELLTALGALRVSVVAFERGKGALKSVLPHSRRALSRSVPDAPLFTRLLESQGVYTTEDVRIDTETLPLRDFLGSDTRGLLILPVGTAETRMLVLVHGGEDTRFGLNEIELARTIGNQTSISLENTRLYQSTVRTAERFAILNQVSSEINSSLDPEEIYVFIHKAVQRLMPVEAFAIALLDKENQEVNGVYLIDGDQRSPNQRLPLGAGLSGHIIASGEPLLIHGMEQVDELGGVTYGEQGTPSSILAVPMTLGGETIGVLSAQSYQANVYNQDDLQILSTLANQAIVAIQNGRLFAETQRLAEELEQRVVERTAQLQREQQNTETLLRILTEVSSSLDLDRALNRTLALLNEAIGAEQGTIMLLQPDDNLLHYRAGYGYLTRQAVEESKAVTLRVGEGLAGWVLENRQAVLIEDLHQDPRWVRVSAGSREHRSGIVAPMLVGEDVIGVLMVFHRKVAHFSPEILNLVQAIAGQVAVAINNAHLYELIRDQAERLGTMLRKQQEEASRSQAILEAVADGVLVTGFDNRVTFINNSAEHILDLPSSHILGQSLDTFGGLFGKAAAAWMQTIRGWSENSASYQAGDSYAEQIELDNKRIVLVHLAPVMLQNDFLGTVSIFRDITHEVEVDRLKSEFVATVSHELRTPMTSIRGYADILLLGAAGALNENQSHFLQIIKNNTERLNILVNDLLDISRIEAGRVTLAPQPLDLREVAEDVLADILRRSQEENKPMAISLEAPKELPRVFGDSERVRQILDNLVDNAYHYTPVDGQIQVRLHSENGEVRVDVTDTGVGVSPEDQERVFERFYRGEHPLVLATPGTGLGLPIVKQLVEMHHGRIWMTSKGIPGEGSTFSFTLPAHHIGPSGRGKNGKNTNR
ncbi:MAG: GAF domain-containing protein [Anaerolineaceae bacterium]|nr:MAG: GAF domain-containing protein [Anaerolineaceae bacterium]